MEPDTATAAPTAPRVVNLAALRAQDVIKYDVKNPDPDPEAPETLGWMWDLAGPNHPATIAHQQKVTAGFLTESRRQQQAQANGKKWKAEDRSPEDLREAMLDQVCARVLGFGPVDLGDGPIQYSPAEARKLLGDRRFGWLLNQISGALAEDANFFAKSAKT